MKKWRKNLVAGAVLLTVCGGIYLNWHYADKQASTDLTDTLDADKVMSEDQMVLADGDLLADQVEGTTMSQYFASVRLARQEARDSAVMLLQEAMAYGEDGQSTTTNAQLEEIVQTALDEAQIESLVIAKGYTDCVAYIADNAISVAVASPEGGMKDSDIAVIADIILSQSQFGMEDIRIVEVH